MNKQQYFALSAFADNQPVEGYSEAAWNALFAGDTETALREQSRLLDPSTGEPLAQADEKRVRAERRAAAGRDALQGLVADVWSRYRAKHGGGDA